MTELIAKKPRIEWIDAMRGFTMILVVAYHVSQQAFLVDIKQSASLPFLVLFRMPLFFFISGFLAYRSKAVWSAGEYVRMVGKKARVQLVPTVVFFLVAAILLSPGNIGKYLTAGVHSPTGGYWFTIALFHMLFIYYTYCFIVNHISKHARWTIFLLWGIAIAAYETVYLPQWFDYAFGSKHPHEGWLFDTKFIQVMQYFQFFVYGNIVHRYWDRFQRLLDTHWFVLLVMLLAFLSCADFLKLHVLEAEWTNLSRTVGMYAMLTLVFMFFRHYEAHVTRQTRLGRTLQYIGTRTLDIYMIHKLLIPNLPEVGQFFNQHHHNFVAEVVLSVAVALVVIGFCLLISNVLRLSPILKKYLFGR